jgi:hypothetical protein
MLGKAFSRLVGGNPPVPAAPQRSIAGAPPAGIEINLACMVSSAGRINLNILQRMVHAAPREDFIRFVPNPVLVGSAVHMGTLSAARADSRSRDMNRTILFEPAEEADHAASASESLKHAIYPLVKSAHANTAGNFFSIGRIDGNDLIMPDYSISKKHAVIEVKRGIYFLKDCTSTNGTLLNGNRLQTKPVEIHDRNVISFARYEFTFLLPGSLYDMLQGS